MSNKNFKTELRKRALILVEPRQSFIDWVKDIAENDPWGRSDDQIYSSTSCTAWAVKCASLFSDYQSFESYIEDYKKDFLRVEVTSIYSGEVLFPHEITSQVFDMFFSIRIVEPIVDIEELTK